LLKELQKIEGEFWIRLLYTHPAHWSEELITTIAQCDKVARYIDMPLQHISANMLERMQRETSEEYIRTLVQRIRAGIPGVTLRTTFIVGFPGETEADFATLQEFIRETKFERLGVFRYSQEEGSRAAKMEHQIPEKVKKQRWKAAMALQREKVRGWPAQRPMRRKWMGRSLFPKSCWWANLPPSPSGQCGTMTWSVCERR
jgi:ribosomal protein S12 methylthiotransferase